MRSSSIPATSGSSSKNPSLTECLHHVGEDVRDAVVQLSRSASSAHLPGPAYHQDE
jgi:hypothetical protein